MKITWRQRFVYFWLLPALALHLMHIITVESQYPAWKRLLFIEDACPYLMCLILPGLIFALTIPIIRPAGAKRES